MDITLTSDSLKASLKTLLLVASTSPGDGPASEIRLTAKSGSVVAEAVNKLGTQWMRLRLEAEVAADGSVCVPASSFSKVVSLLASPQVRLLAEEGKVKVKTAAGGRSGEQALVGMPAENWGSGRKAAKNAVALKINTQVLLDLPKHTSFSCSKNRTKAPLTAINAFCGSGWLRCTSCDQVRVSQFDAPDSSEGDGSFMLPVPAAAVLGAALRGTDPDAMVDVRVDPGHVDFEGESFRLSFTLE
jgi:DNA polymerase III sliding clamp (beta) subunit (PCNA family)